MKTPIRAISEILVVAFVLVILCLAVLEMRMHFETERKITSALESGFPGASLSIKGRVDWEYRNQICFDVLVHARSRGLSGRKIVMVNGDMDGGTWWLGDHHEYMSMTECKRDFYQG